MRKLPEVRRSSRTFATGRPGAMQEQENFRYEALVLSEPHWRLRNGAWSGGGPFYAYKMGVEHKGLLRLPYSAYGVDGPWAICCVHPGLDGLPSGWNAGKDPSSWTAWPLLVDGLRDLYAEGYRRARPGSPEASLGVAISELVSDGLPALPLLQGRLQDVAHSLMSGRGGIPPATAALGRGPGLAAAIRELRRSVSDYARAPIPKGIQQRVNGALRESLTPDPSDAAAALRAAKLAAGEYLNQIFGWLPLVKDLREVYNLTQTIANRLKNIQENNGKWQRKAVTIRKGKTTEVTRSVEWGGCYFAVNGAPPDFPIKGWTRHVVTRTTEYNSWWKGQFRYWIPPEEFDTWLWKGKAAAHLFGVFPTPQVIYAATPWSWLIDWWARMDTVLANISPNAVDNLVLRHGYVMDHVVVTTKARSHVVHDSSDDSYPGVPGFFWPAVDHEFESIYSVERKTRIGSIHPFGSLKYGDSPGAETITPRRAAVLAALGLTRAGR